MKPAIVIALIKKQSRRSGPAESRSGPAESNDYLWDVATESAWFFSNCLHFLVVLPFKFWSLCNCIQLYRKEKVRRKPKGSIEESIFEIFFFKLTFSSCKFYATASFDISHTCSSGKRVRPSNLVIFTLLATQISDWHFPLSTPFEAWHQFIHYAKAISMFKTAPPSSTTFNMHSKSQTKF